MRVAAISDFHIGARDGGAFGHDPGGFESFLDELETSHDKIVLLGDIYQTDHGWWPDRGSRARQLRAARSRWHRLARRFDARPYLYVFGNHDLIASAVVGASESVRLQGGAAAALFIHGHQFDPVAGRAPLAAHLGTWATGRMRALGLRRVARYFEHKDIAIKDRRFAGPTGPYARAGERLARQHEVSVVVMGHTHCARIDVMPNTVVVNTGTCSDGRRCWVSLDLDQGQIRLHADGAERRVTVDARGKRACAGPDRPRLYEFAGIDGEGEKT